MPDASQPETVRAEKPMSGPASQSGGKPGGKISGQQGQRDKSTDNTCFFHASHLALMVLSELFHILKSSPKLGLFQNQPGFGTNSIYQLRNTDFQKLPGCLYTQGDRKSILELFKNFSF
jgi:hypothetical protein